MFDVPHDALMEIKTTRTVALPSGCQLNKVHSFLDERGSLQKIDVKTAKQVITVVNKDHTVRGIHGAPSTKTVFLVRGSVFDVLVDLREHSNTYGMWWGQNLQEGDCLEIAAGVGHAYYSANDSVMTYAIQESYKSETEIRIDYQDSLLNIDWPLSSCRDQIRISAADQQNQRFAKVLVYGASGFLGSLIAEQLRKDKYRVVKSKKRFPDWEGVQEELQSEQPDCVVYAAGKGGVPSATWHDLNWELSLESNVRWPAELAQLIVRQSRKRAIYSIFIGSGVVFSDSHTAHSEEEILNPVPSGYGLIRQKFEEAMMSVPHFKENGSVLRIMYPVAPGDHRCLLNKLKSAKSVHAMPSSVSVMPSLLPLLSKIIEQKLSGLINFVNRGVMSPVDIVGMLRNGEDLGSVSIVPKPASVAAVWLSTSKLEQVAGFPTEDVQTLVREYCT